ncbi:hypothetical protein COOONC_19077 [Cooperia oncophora]
MKIQGPMNQVLLILVTVIIEIAFCLTREELLEHLKSKQDTQNTPIWPRVLEKVKSEAELFFDDDNFAYQVAPHRDAVALIRKLDKEQNYNTVLRFLEKFT